MKKLLILGDSSSMSIGLEHKTYPFLLSQKQIWPANTLLINGSAPGFTAAGVNAFFQNFNNRTDLKAVIVYIGNNDGVWIESPRGRYTAAKKWIQKLQQYIYLRINQKFTPMVSSPFEWNAVFHPAAQKTEDLRNYYYNLEQIVSWCHRHVVPLILIKPKANALFPAGLGRGNFMFYKYIDMYDTTAHSLVITDHHFVQALALHEQKKYQAACKLYCTILENLSDGMSDEYPLVVAANYAVVLAQSGDMKGAESLLQLLMRERHVRVEILLYNLAQLHKRKKDIKQYKRFLAQAYQQDRSIYRVQEEYRMQLDDLAAAYPKTVRMIDMETFIDDSNYIDYCHVDYRGHRVIAEMIAFQLHAIGIRGTEKASLHTILPNPELARGIRGDLYTYIGLYAESAATRFADFFDIQKVIPYLRIAQKKKLYTLFSQQSSLLRRPDELHALLPEQFQHAVVSVEELIIPDQQFVFSILSNIKSDLYEHAANGNQIYNRLKTTIYWYFRESLYFGFHSRISMRYDRIFLEKTAQRLAMAWMINKENNGKLSRVIIKYIQCLNELEAIHESHCRHFSLTRDYNKLLQAYDTNLAQIARKIKAL